MWERARRAALVAAAMMCLGAGAATRPAEDPTVYGTRTGAKYHSARCSYLKSSVPMKLSEAKARGLTACSRCRPPQ